MMSLYSNIQALGNRMASNLETMGVSASFNDGGLTLADKILMIQHFTNGLILYGDKDIIQTGETVNLSAVLLKDGKAVSGETITFFQEIIPTTKIDTNVEYWCYTVDGDGEITFTGKTVGLFQEGQDNVYSYGWGSNGTISVSVSNSTLTVAKDGTPLSPLSFTYDSSKPLVIWVNKTYTILTNSFGVIGTDTTDSSGVASVSYVGKGSGELNIRAITSDHVFQSEIYSVLDTILNWEGTNGTVPSIIKSSSDTMMSLISDSNGLSMANSHSTTTYYCGLDKEQSSSSITDWIDWCDVAFEFEYVSNTGNVVFQLRPQSSSVISYNLNNCSNGDIIRVEYSNGVVNVFKNNTNVLTRNMNVGELTVIRFSLAPSNTLTIKNLKLWSI